MTQRLLSIVLSGPIYRTYNSDSVLFISEVGLFNSEVLSIISKIKVVLFFSDVNLINCVAVLFTPR